MINENKENAADVKLSETDQPSTRAEGKHREQEREPWMTGVVLILAGLVFILRNSLNLRFDNWWALFILIPAFNSFESA